MRARSLWNSTNLTMIDTKTCAELLGVNMKRVAVLAATGRIRGAKKLGGRWAFPDKPVVSRGTRGPVMRRERKV
jgi:predicted site-specific integrase-resolvase